MQDIVLFLQQHWMLCAALVVVVVLLTILELIKIKQGGERLSPAQVTNLINHSDAVIVDVRPTETFTTGHIIDAVSMPIAKFEEKIKKLEKFKSRPIVVVCAMGNESPKAAVLLKQQGFQTYILSGGIRGWRESEMPVVKG